MTKSTKIKRRAIRVRASLNQGVVRPRLSIHRSQSHIWAQIIDDSSSQTLAAANDTKIKGTKTEKARQVGTAISLAAQKAKIKTVVFDRGSYHYHGRVKALAEAAREAGLQF